jgi:hypothetical protein
MKENECKGLLFTWRKIYGINHDQNLKTPTRMTRCCDWKKKKLGKCALANYPKEIMCNQKIDFSNMFEKLVRKIEP